MAAALLLSQAMADTDLAGGCTENGRLAGTLYGDIDATLDWQGAMLACDGMPRPDGAGARLRFEGRLESSTRLALIIALPELERGATARETPATVTIMAVDQGRFFSNGDAANCWSDIGRHEADAAGQYAVAGIVYCLAPLAEINGDGSVAFTELAFAGQLNWTGS